MLTVLCKSYAAENAPDYGCVSCVTLRVTGYGLRGRISVSPLHLFPKCPAIQGF